MNRLRALVLILFFSMSGVVGATSALADEPAVQFNRPVVVDSWVSFCSPKAARKGRCDRGAPIVRLVVAIPSCWTVEVHSRGVTSGMPYTSVYDTSCTPDPAAEPELRRLLLQL